MNKLMLASITVLLAGGLALPVEAQDNRRRGGDTAENDRGRDAERADRGDRRGERGEGRGNRGEARGQNPGRGDDSAGRRAHAGPPQGTPRQFAPPPGRGPSVQPDRRPVVAQSAVRAPVAQGRYDRRDDRRDSRYDRRDDRRDDRYGRRDDRRDNRYDRRDDRRDWNNDRRQDYRHYARGNNHRWNGNQWHPQYRYRAPVRYVYPRGYRPHQWRVGYRLPPAYYHRNYYVDYRNYYLPPPPYGYHWVRVDRDVVLVSIASGLIRDILYGLYY
jgi:Ni/Co efflux regulator RcnB